MSAPLERFLPGFCPQTQVDPLQQNSWDLETPEAGLNALDQSGFEPERFQAAKTQFEMGLDPPELRGGEGPVYVVIESSESSFAREGGGRGH